MSRRETRGRLDRLTSTMRELLIALFNHTMLPATSNNSRTFAALEERGLIQPDFYDNWALTDEGHRDEVVALLSTLAEADWADLRDVWAVMAGGCRQHALTILIRKIAEIENGRTKEES